MWRAQLQAANKKLRSHTTRSDESVKKYNLRQRDKKPLGILPVPRQVGQVSPAGFPFMVPYVGKCFRLCFLFESVSVSVSILSGTSVGLLLVAGVTMTPSQREKESSALVKFNCKMTARRLKVLPHKHFKRPIKSSFLCCKVQRVGVNHITALY